MSESYYTGTRRCQECDHRRPDAKPREIADRTVVLCGDCALQRYLRQRQRSP